MNVTFENVSDSKNYEGDVSITSTNTTSVLFILPFVLTLTGVLWNGLLLQCFYRNRNDVWIKDTGNVICNITSDFVVSILNTVVVALTVIPGEVKLPLEICHLKGFLTGTLQCVSLNHILALCIDRLRIAINIRRIQRSGVSPYKRSIAIWICTFVIGFLPYAFNTNQDHNLVCTAKTTPLQVNSRLVNITYLVLTSVPWLITNILFITTAVMIWRNIGAAQQKPDPVQDDGNTIQTISGNRRIGDPKIVHGIRYISQTNGQSTETVKPIRATNVNSQQSRTKKHVMVTIGLLLIVFNISMWPLVFSLIGSQLSETFEINERLYILVFLNQTVNPIVYTVRLARLRQAMKEVLWAWCNCFG